ncbi:hypothetical protein Tco_0145263, partial [Tanacetum coccineum]
STWQSLKDLHQSKLQAYVKDYFPSKGLRLLLKVSIAKRRRSNIVIEEVAQSKEVAEDVDSKETNEEPPVRRRSNGVVIGGEVRSEGSRVTLEVPDELTLKSSNEGASVTPKVLDEPSDHSSNSSCDLEFVVEDISSDEADITKKSDKAKKAKTEKDTYQKANEEYSEKPEVINVNSSLTLSSAEFISQFLNDNLEVTINEVLKDLVEHEVQSMVDVPVTQAKPAEQRPQLVDITITLIPDTTTVSPTQSPLTQQKRRKIKRILKISKRLESQVNVGELENRVTRLVKKVHAMSSFNLPEEIDKSVKAHLKNVLPKVSLSVDEDDMDKKLKDPPVHKKRGRDDQDQNPPTNADKESKKKNRKDADALSSKKTKDHPTFSKK